MPLRGDSIQADLAARDLTVNALALDSAGRLYLHPQALGDLQGKILRPASSAAFASDPLRIFRLARFACRYGWQPDDHTYRLMEEALSGMYLTRLSPDRIRNEIALFFREENLRCGFDLLMEWGVMEHLLPGAKLTETDFDRLMALSGECDLPLKLLTLFASMPRESLDIFWEKIGISPKRRERLAFLQELCLNIDERVRNCPDDYDLLLLVRSFRGAETALWKAFASEDSQSRINYCLQVVQERKLTLSREDLKAFGIEPGSTRAARCMEALARKKANGELETPEAERLALQALLKENP